VFAGLAMCWLVILCVVIHRWQHTFSGWLAVGFAAAHAMDAASWLPSTGPWGRVAAGVYLAVASRASSWCWSRYGRRK